LIKIIHYHKKPRLTLEKFHTFLRITLWLNDVARFFAQCGEAQAGTPAPRFSLC